MIRLSLLLPLSILLACTQSKELDDTADTGADPGDTAADTDDTVDDTADDTSDTGPDTGDTQPPDPIAIAGAWVDNWGGNHAISSVAWESWSDSYIISQFDNDAGFAVAQNDADNSWNGGLWSRFDWAWIGDDLAYCQTAYDAASESAALATPAADASSPDSGCNGFPWTWLRAPVALQGFWETPVGSYFEVTAFSWSFDGFRADVVETNDAEGWAVARNALDGELFPGKWSRFEWMPSEYGEQWACQSAYDAATEEEARDLAADRGDLGAGCNGGYWTPIRRPLPIEGTWADGWGGSHTITAFVWENWGSVFEITEANASEGWLLAQNSVTNTYAPGLWSRFDWTWDSAGTLWYCQTAYEAASEADARATPAADPGDPATSGCGGFSWTSLAPAAF